MDYGDQFDYRAGAGRNTAAGNQPSAQAASNGGLETGPEQPGVDRQASLNIGTAIQLMDDQDASMQ